MNSRWSYFCQKLKRFDLYNISDIVLIMVNRVGVKSIEAFHKSKLGKLFPDGDFFTCDKETEVTLDTVSI